MTFHDLTNIDSNESFRIQMNAMFTLLQSPYAQLLALIVILLVMLLLSGGSSKAVKTIGIFLLLLWMLAGGVLGISSEIRWTYFIHLALAQAIGYGLWIVFMIVADTWGKPYKGDSGHSIFVPPMLLMPIMLLALAAKVFLESL